MSTATIPPQPRPCEDTWLSPAIREVKLQSWKHFYDLACDELLDETGYIWRGQSCDNWKLEPSLDRLLEGKSETEHREETNKHLDRFQYAMRGRLGSGSLQPNKRDLNEWWALGQHQGLATPLLDWTKSPFVALYFAFSKEESDQTPMRAVYAIQRDKIHNRSNEIRQKWSGDSPAPTIEFVSPFIGDNPRLINQGGLFSKAPPSVTIRQWIEKHMPEEDYPEAMESGEGILANLIKIGIPDAGREECLRALNRMNINHLTLFPDPFGASEYCNKSLSIFGYDYEGNHSDQTID